MHYNLTTKGKFLWRKSVALYPVRVVRNEIILCSTDDPHPSELFLTQKYNSLCSDNGVSKIDVRMQYCWKQVGSLCMLVSSN